MSLELACGTHPSGVEIKVHGFNSALTKFREDGSRIVKPKELQNNVVHCSIPGVGCVCIPIEDFLAAANYVLTNTDLEDDKDPRLVFIEAVKSAKVVEGRNSGTQRIELGSMDLLTHKKEKVSEEG